MKKITDSKIFLIIISVLVSFAIWVYVTGMEGDEYTTTFRSVPVQLVGEETLRNSRNMVITDLDISTVSVEITGPRRIVASLSSSDLVAQVDVSKLTQAAYTSQQYTVIFPDGIDKSQLRVNRKTPDTVNFMVSALTTKTVQVRGSFDGMIAENCTAETPVFEPSTITLIGAEIYLKDVTYAWVTFGEDIFAETSYSIETGFTLMDASGNPCQTTGITLSDESVVATLPLLEVKDVKLTVDIIEGAGATSANTKVTIEPEYVTLAGDSTVLSGMNKIVIKTIDLSDFASTYTETFTIPLDNDIKNISGISEAQVTVEIVGLATKTFKCSNISVENVTNGFSANLLTTSMDVVLRGLPSEIDSINASDIEVIADLADYNESVGTYLADAKVRVKGYDNVGAIGDNTVSLEIRKA